jgi:tRNA (mo5U34)-methyltransferase
VFTWENQSPQSCPRIPCRPRRNNFMPRYRDSGNVDFVTPSNSFKKRLIDEVSMNREELIKEVARYSWVHSIDLGNGVVTKGIFGDGRTNPLITKAFDDIDFSRKKVLDIGCWDGLWSFEAEKRGAAAVYATDDVSQRPFQEQPTFRLAHQALGSKVKYYPNVSLYKIESLNVCDFDIVVFCGVYYHLKDPLLALTKLRRVMKVGGLIIVEGEAIYSSNEVLAKFFYHTHHARDASNWWVPTIPCLREWVECSFFEIVNEYGIDLLAADKPPFADKKAREEMLAKVIALKTEAINRYTITAKAVCRVDPGYGVPDEELKPFACGAWG